ncbi:YkgJ family cysteine cluster protein [Ferrimonas pelagia]|uniref:YkgJ family cysteine cluster protein n=1 Tax=Ferrimonas pelagia TaxID=1177826 RepID=A0ABP9EGU5_9GAMM
MQCRLGCGACCIAPSITSAIPGMPHGKPAGERCIQLGDDNLCRIFGQPERPAVCSDFKPDSMICGGTDAAVLQVLTELEAATLRAS